MKDFFIDLFEYHHHFNQLVCSELMQNKQHLSERTIPLFSHMINAHQIWNSRIMGTTSLGVNDIHTLEGIGQLDRENFNQSIQILSTYDLDQRLEYQNSKGRSFVNPVKEVLFHVINHTTHHRGQIISDLRMNGLVPPVTDYIFYKR